MAAVVAARPIPWRCCCLANSVLFLISDRARHVALPSLYVDGGARWLADECAEITCGNKNYIYSRMILNSFYIIFNIEYDPDVARRSHPSLDPLL